MSVARWHCAQCRYATCYEATLSRAAHSEIPTNFGSVRPLDCVLLTVMKVAATAIALLLLAAYPAIPAKKATIESLQRQNPQPSRQPRARLPATHFRRPALQSRRASQPGRRAPGSRPLVPSLPRRNANVRRFAKRTRTRGIVITPIAFDDPAAAKDFWRRRTQAQSLSDGAPKDSGRVSALFGAQSCRTRRDHRQRERRESDPRQGSPNRNCAPPSRPRSSSLLGPPTPIRTSGRAPAAPHRKTGRVLRYLFLITADLQPVAQRFGCIHASVGQRANFDADVFVKLRPMNSFSDAK